MIYIYRSAASNGAVELARALNGRKIRNLDRVDIRAGDVLVCWGESANRLPRNVKVLNGSPFIDKFTAALRLKEAGVPTVEVARTKPRQAAQTAEPTLDVARLAPGQVSRTAVAALIRTLNQWLTDNPHRAVEQVIWLPRRLNHVGGHDLLNPPQAADFYSRKENLVEEYRIHCFKGKSIRAGKKGARQGHTQHEWIRSLDAGWAIHYEGFKSSKAMRDIAAAALEALHLDFGAVDLAKKADGSLLVLEVNRAPGLEGNTIKVYADAIQEWAQGA